MNTKSKIPKAAIYCRQSATMEKGEKSLSINDQIRDAEEAIKSMGWQVVRVEPFIDKNFAGYTYPDNEIGHYWYNSDKATQAKLKSTTKDSKEYFRKGLAELFNYLDEIDYIVVLTEDRLFRSIHLSNFANNIKYHFVSKNVKIFCVEGRSIIDYSSNRDELLSIIQNQVKSSEIILRAQQAKDGKRDKRNNGYAPITNLRGYTIQRDKMTPTRDLPHIKEAFKMFLNGSSKKDIYTFLVNNKINVFSINDVNVILRNPAYCGHWFYNTKTKTDLRLNKQFEGIEPIISLNEWKQVQFKLGQYIKSKTPTNRYDYIHTGTIKCVYCEKPMTVIESNGVKYLACSSWKLQNKYMVNECKSNKTRLENGKNGQYGLNQFLIPFSFHAFYRYQQGNDGTKEIDGEIEVLKSDLVMAENRVNSYVSALRENSDLLNTLIPLLREFENKVKEIKENISKKEQERLLVANVTYDLSKGYKIFERLTNKEINKLLRLSVDGFKMYREKVVVKIDGKDIEMKKENVGKICGHDMLSMPMYNYCTTLVEVNGKHQLTLYFNCFDETDWWEIDGKQVWMGGDDMIEVKMPPF